MQLKAAADLSQYALKASPCFSYPIEVKDLLFWRDHLLPFYLILYDAALREAYWLNVHDLPLDEQQLQGEQVRLRVPFENILGVRTLYTMRERKIVALPTYQTNRQQNK